jgi:hypothetical protein
MHRKRAELLGAFLLAMVVLDQIQAAIRGASIDRGQWAVSYKEILLLSSAPKFGRRDNRGPWYHPALSCWASDVLGRPWLFAYSPLEYSVMPAIRAPCYFQVLLLIFDGRPRTSIGINTEMLIFTGFLDVLGPGISSRTNQGRTKDVPPPLAPDSRMTP